MSDDYAASTSTGGRITVGESTPGSIEIIGDTDWFWVTLIAGHQHRFDLKGRDSGYGLPDPFLRLRDSAGTPITFDDDSGTEFNSQITYTATYSGTYYLSAGSAVTGSGTGAYLVGAVDLAPTQSTNYTLTPSPTTVTEGN